MQQAIIEGDKKEVKFDDEPIISFIVPAHAGHLDKSILKRCLMSLDEQDYENIEVVVVVNGGSDKGLEDTANFFVNQNPDKYKLVVTDQPGACNARNLGFENSKGEIVSFFNSDYRAKPGMARMWVETLVNNPDCGFIYGGYEYATAPAYTYNSKGFDEYELDVANYIDCGFPLWRKYVVRWDPEVKSLQDWDFWLNVVKTHKIKGFYIERDLSFIAEPPRKGGLSNDSFSNWVDRVKFVKNKHNIPLRDIVVTSLGARYHGVQIAKMIGADFRDDTIYKPNEYKAIYLIGYYVKPNLQFNEHAHILGSFPQEVKKIIHFVGADIYWLRRFPWESMQILAGAMKMGADHVLCENEQAQKELAAFGIESKIVPIPPYNDYEVKPLPEKFKVAIYLTDKSDFDKYFQSYTLSIVRAMPDVEFIGYGDGGKDFRSPNFTHIGNVSNEKWKETVYESSCVLRLVRHDTLPMAACDFFLAGRHVVSNIKLEGGIHIDTQGHDAISSWDPYTPGFSPERWPQTKKKIVQEIRKLRKNKETNPAAGYWANVLDRQKYINTIHEMSGIKGGSNA